MNYLLINSLRISDSPTAHPILVSYLTGQNELNPEDLDSVVSPIYSAHQFQIRSTFLNKVQPQIDDYMVAELVALTVGLPATGVLFDAAVRQLGLPYTVVVAISDAQPYPFVLKRS